MPSLRDHGRIVGIGVGYRLVAVVAVVWLTIETVRWLPRTGEASSGHAAVARVAGDDAAHHGAVAPGGSFTVTLVSLLVSLLGSLSSPALGSGK